MEQNVTWSAERVESPDHSRKPRGCARCGELARWIAGGSARYGPRMTEDEADEVIHALALALIAGERAVLALAAGERVDAADLDGLVSGLVSIAEDAHITSPIVSAADIERARVLRDRLASEGPSPGVRALAAAYPLAITEGTGSQPPMMRQNGFRRALKK